ncbi:NADH-quinone oxidoreductase subunit K [Desulfosalsimonas propionicica]|uniref:NADH-quinone oxidoreductase subunit K n=1 Tax=Desulfosalsimonas propionicica TaxID=332175 RepID=A0A7W0CAY7_9BACT|nr:NADH-quinone oxidoreductase subunit NuoK [Desulfosalsimonas propionicica]MBA2882390.1 NADH-quinone oxidoreductase subunit K [Desulfosalsimonas propionicica]
MIVPYTHVMLLGAIVFLMGMICTLTRRNLIMIIVGLEIMLNAAAIVFVGAGLQFGQIEGQVMALFIVAVAAAEVSVGLAMVVCIYRQRNSIDPQCMKDSPCVPDPKETGELLPNA